MPSYGVTPAGFKLKPFSAILADEQSAWLANVDPGLDLSPTSPEGQIVTIQANRYSFLWALAQACYNAFDRQAAEGKALDNIGDLVGIPREDESFTQVLCTLTWTDSGTVHAPGTLTANIIGLPALTFVNVSAVTSNGGTIVGVLFESTTAGATPTVNPNTLTEITSPISGWATITNPLAQSQLGANEEGDAAYAERQDAEEGAQGSCNLPAVYSALVALGAAQSPPVPLTVNVIENDGEEPLVVGSLTLPPHSFAAIVYDPTFTLTSAQIGAVIYANKPPGIATVGTTAVTIADPNLGNQTVYYTTPTPEPLYVVMTVAVRPKFVFATVRPAVQTSLAEAAVANTPSSGQPPVGQFLPGSPAVASQLEAVVSGVPGVFDIQSLTFGFAPAPTNTGLLVVDPTQIITLSPANVTVNPGSYP